MARAIMVLQAVSMVILILAIGAAAEIDVQAGQKDLTLVKERELLTQLGQLQKEAKQLQSELDQNSGLKGRFEAVTKELGATKDTLTSMLSQLADKSKSISATEQRIVEATEQLQAARLERDEAKEKLAQLESTALDGASQLQQEMEMEKKQRTDMQGELTKLRAETSKLATELAESKKVAKEAQKDLAEWQSRAEKAEKRVTQAEKILEKAMQDHSTTQSALIQAEAKAEEAMKKVEGLLTSWLPHWLSERYHQLLVAAEPVLKHVQPTLEKLWAQSKVYWTQGSQQASRAYDVTKSRSQKAWKEAQPTVDKQWKGLQKQYKSYSKHAGKVAGPFVADLKLRLSKAYQSAAKQISQFLSRNRTVLKLQRNAKQTLRELEALAIRYMRQIPFLRDYAQKPAVTYLVYGLLAAPIITILVPLLTLKGEKQKPKRRSTTATKASAAIPEQPATDKNGRGHKPKKPRNAAGGRISVDGEHIRVP